MKESCCQIGYVDGGRAACHALFTSRHGSIARGRAAIAKGCAARHGSIAQGHGSIAREHVARHGSIARGCVVDCMAMQVMHHHDVAIISWEWFRAHPLSKSIKLPTFFFWEKLPTFRFLLWELYFGCLGIIGVEEEYLFFVFVSMFFFFFLMVVGNMKKVSLWKTLSKTRMKLINCFGFSKNGVHLQGNFYK